MCEFDRLIKLYENVNTVHPLSYSNFICELDKWINRLFKSKLPIFDGFTPAGWEFY